MYCSGTEDNKIIRHSCVAHPRYFGGPMIGKAEECSECMEYIKDNTPDPVAHEWWKNKNNFPCCIVAETDADGLTMTIVHYAQDSIAYDFRSNEYKLENSNWRRATKQEVSLLSNFKN